MAMNTLFGQERLNLSSRKHYPPAIISDNRNIFCNALINFEILIVRKTERKMDDLILKHKKSRGSIHSPD